MDKLDQFFKDKLQDREFEFKDVYWQDAEQLIEQDKRKKRLIWWKWLAGWLLLLLLIIAGGLWLTLGPRVQSSPEQKEIKENNLAEQSGPVKKVDTASGNAETFVELDSLNTEKGRQSSIKKRKKIPGLKEHHLLQNKDKTPELNHKGEPEWFELPKAVRDKEKEDASEAMREFVVDQSQLDSSFRKSEKVLMAGLSFLPGRWNSIEANMSDLPIPGKPLWLEGSVESPRLSRVKFGLQFSAMTYPNTRGDNLSFIGLAGGLDIAYKLKNHYYLETAVQLRRRTGTFAKVDETQVLFFSFGRSSSKFELLPSALYYLEMPLGLSRSFGFHHLEAGITTSYLLGVKGALENTQNPELVQDLIKAERGWVEQDGFKKWHWDIYLGYSWQYSKKMGLQFSLNYTPGTILDPSFNAFQEVVLKESQPLFLDVGIRYKLF